jgi:TonB family protein
LWLLPVAAVQAQTPKPAILYNQEGDSIIATEAQNFPRLIKLFGSMQAEPTPKGTEGQRGADNHPPSITDTIEDRLSLIAGKSAEDCGIIFIPLRAPDDEKIAAAGDCAERALSEKKPFHVFYIINGIDGIGFMGLAMSAGGDVYQLSLATVMQGSRMRYPDPNGGVQPCPKPVRLERLPGGWLVCTAPPAADPMSSSNGPAAPVVPATSQTIASVQSIPNAGSPQGGADKNPASARDTTDDGQQTIEVHAQVSQPQTLYDQGEVSVVATETKDTLELAVSEPDPILVSIEVDRNQNGQFDRLVDVAYRPQASGNVCPQYLIDGQYNTPCGGFASHAYLKDFKDDLGRRGFILVLPKKEISFDLPSARLVFVFRDTALRHTSYYPMERFQKAIDVPYLIKQDGAAANSESLDGEGRNSFAPLPAVSYRVFTDSAGSSVENGLGDHDGASGGVYKVGGSVSPPVLQQRVLANYSDEALRAKRQGACLIEMIVDAQGTVQNPKVIRPLGMGLDEKALQAIRNWKFKPAMKDGQTPVPVMINVEVSFRLVTPAQTDGGNGSSPSETLAGSNTKPTNGAGLGITAGDGLWPGDEQSADAGIYKVGGNVSRPVVRKKVDAEFSDQARRAKYQGVCILALIVDAQGNPQNVHVIRALGMGLDEKAMEAVRKYKFKPAMKDGKTPVPVMITVEVDFRLYTPAQ